MEDEQWSPGIIVAIALVALGLSVGAVGTAVFFTPASALLGDPALAAWTQALGTLLALAIAVWVPWYQHRSETRARQVQAEEQRKALRQRLTVGLIAEVSAIDQVLESMYESANQVFERLSKAVMENKPVNTDDLPANALHITDAALYRAVTQDLGVLPPELIKSIVGFYTLIAQVERTSAISDDFEGVLDVQRTMIPRLRMSGAFLQIGLSRFRAADYADDVNYQPSNDEAIAEAHRVNYPIHEVAASFGVQMKT